MFMRARSLAWIRRRTSNPETPGSNPGGSALNDSFFKIKEFILHIYFGLVA